MIDLISSKDSDRLNARLRRIRDRNLLLDADLVQEVTAIIDDVRIRGDSALIDYSLRFDGCQLQISDLKVGEQILTESAARVDHTVRDALRQAIANVRRFHEQERQTSWVIAGSNDTSLGQMIKPIDSAGLYVPGGSASYPSSVIMNVVPAQVAGVPRITVTTPPKTIQKTPAVAAALCELGVREVYAVGGAQAIAALAFGTETIAPVDKITGPGNRYVALAKKLVFGIVGIDSIAGPSEVIVLADDSADARYVAADLLAQAEHGEDACALLITTSETLAAAVQLEIERQNANLPRREITERSLAQYGAIIVVDDPNQAIELINELAPEHLEIMMRNADQISEKVRNCGAIFFGSYSPEAVGDYFAGPNHVLPTARTARFASALGVHDFIKRINIVKFSKPETQRTGAMIAALARAEGLEAHARSVLARLNSDDND
jgi:histidinol dehydrogenase